jgi:uncharacterized protein YbjT (DUF2867 family)
MSSTSERLVLVTGGTGNQGGATVKHLLGGKRTRIRVLTRSPDSPKAQRLASLGVELAIGDMDDAASLQKALAGVSAAYSVQNFAVKGGTETEKRRGIAFADAVKAANVPFLVYSSAEGVERENNLEHYRGEKGPAVGHRPRHRSTGGGRTAFKVQRGPLSPSRRKQQRHGVPAR